MTIRNLDIEVELIHVNFSRGENKNDEFLKLNPTGQVPVLIEDDGFILTEPRAIIAYLVASRDKNSSLYPLNDPIKRALIDERLFFDATTVFHSHVQILVRKKVDSHLVWRGSCGVKMIFWMEIFLPSKFWDFLRFYFQKILGHQNLHPDLTFNK